MQVINISHAYVDLRRPTIFAHRGASAYAPENTIAAFKLAINQSADAIELDAKLTADGEVVVMHDDTVDRTTNGTGRIQSLMLIDLKRLDAGAKFSSSFVSEKIPTLAEVFEAAKGKIFINVELANYSSPTDDLPEKAADLVKKFHLEGEVLFSSFNPLALIRMRNSLPKVPLGLLTHRGLAEIAYRSKLIKFSKKLAIHPDYQDVTPRLAQLYHRSGSWIHAYTVNQPESMHDLFSIGVDGIFTDDPLMAIKVRAESNQKTYDSV